MSSAWGGWSLEFRLSSKLGLAVRWACVCSPVWIIKEEIWQQQQCRDDMIITFHFYFLSTFTNVV